MQKRKSCQSPQQVALELPCCRVCNSRGMPPTALHWLETGTTGSPGNNGSRICERRRSSPISVSSNLYTVPTLQWSEVASLLLGDGALECQRHQRS